MTSRKPRARVGRAGDPSYTAVHDQLRRARGKAATYDCVTCGKPAAHWSYDGGDPNQLHVRPDGSLPYSRDLRFYSARCASCHLTLDSRSRMAIIEPAQVLFHYTDGFPVTIIAQILDVPAYRVRQILQDNNIQMRPGHKSKHPKRRRPRPTT